MLRPFLLISLLFPLACSTPAKKLQPSLTFPIAAVERGEVISAWGDSGAYRLNALFLKMNRNSTPGLVILSHGSPIDPKDRALVTPEKMIPQANEFLEMGFAVLILERRGFGKSTAVYSESVGECDYRDNVANGNAAANDLLAAINYAKEKLGIDPKNIILAGVSAGGFASLFAASKNVPGIRATLNFAGGRGSKGNNQVCSESNLLETFELMGQGSKIPSLWIYSENDKVFPPAIAQKFYQSYTQKGGKAELKIAPEFGKDGHELFSRAGIPIWVPYVEEFLEKHRPIRDIKAVP